MSLINDDGSIEINIDKNGNRILPSINKKNNCSDRNKFKSKEFVLEESTKFMNDKCFESGENKQNNNVNDYMLSNYNSCECKLDNVLEISNKNRGITIKDGYGISNCNIDDDTTLRIGNVERHYKSVQQLFPRTYLTAPSIMRGKPKPDIESKIQNAMQIIKHKQMQNYDETYSFTPLNTSLKETIQDPSHIVQELVDKQWVRGGLNSQQIVKDQDYFDRSVDSDIVKNLLLKQKSYII